MNDNVADKKLCHDIIEKVGKIDVYFIQSSSVTIYPACFNMSSKEKLNAVKNRKNDFTYHDIVINNIKPKYLIPYAGDLGWFGTQIDFNYFARSSPIELVAHIKSHGLKSCIFESGDKILVKNNDIQLNNMKGNDWNDYDGLIELNKKYYEKLILQNESRIHNSKIERFKEHLIQYIKSLNKINLQSDAQINSDGSICFQVRRNLSEDLFISVKCVDNRFLKLSFISELPPGVAQLQIIDETIWSEIIKGNFMLSQAIWRSTINQSFIDRNIKNLIFGIGYHIDGDNRSKELKLRPYYQYNQKH